MMGNQGLEPEITREFLNKEYRNACKMLAEMRKELDEAEAKLEAVRKWAESPAERAVIGPLFGAGYEAAKETVLTTLNDAEKEK